MKATRELVFEDRYLCFFVERADNVLLYQRNKRRCDTGAVATAWHSMFEDPPFEPSLGGLLVDVRLAPGRNDPKFESDVNQVICDYARRFSPWSEPQSAC